MVLHKYCVNSNTDVDCHTNTDTKQSSLPNKPQTFLSIANYRNKFNKFNTVVL